MAFLVNTFTKADSVNLPKIDTIMVANFFAANPDFCSAEFRNVKTARSSRETYGDDAIGYVQLCRENDLCVVKCKMCPEHKVNSKQYNVTLTVNEKAEQVISVECHDCVACQGGCKHSVAFLMWVHRRSEEPSCTSIQCYWKKSNLSRVGSTVKFITTKDLSKQLPPMCSAEENNVFSLFMAGAKKRKISNCQLLKYQPNYEVNTAQSLSLHYLCVMQSQSDCDQFLNSIAYIFSEDSVKAAEMETRNQHKNRLWFELRYGRITASKAYEVSRCKVPDGSLVETIMGARTPDTRAMKRGRNLESEVRETVEKHLGQKIKTCGLTICKQYPILAASPDGILNNKSILEIKCPMSQLTYKNYIKGGKISNKFMFQMQMQMYITGLKHGYFCIADPEFEENQKVEIYEVLYNETIIKDTLDVLLHFWKTNIYPQLYRSINTVLQVS